MENITLGQIAAGVGIIVTILGGYKVLYDKINDIISCGDVVILIRHPDHFVLQSGMVILVWTPDNQYHFTRYKEALESSCKIVAAAVEIQRSL